MVDLSGELQQSGWHTPGPYAVHTGRTNAHTGNSAGPAGAAALAAVMKVNSAIKSVTIDGESRTIVE